MSSSKKIGFFESGKEVFSYLCCYHRHFTKISFKDIVIRTVINAMYIFYSFLGGNFPDRTFHACILMFVVEL